MKQILLLATTFVLIAATTAKFKPENKEISKTYVYVPAGSLNGTEVKEFYISASEVTNRQYREFLKDLYQNNQYAKWRDAKVDTAQWRNYLTYNDPYANHYFQHPAYDNYPVVNVSPQGAKLYCQWQAEKYNKAAKRKVAFRLPSEAEWMWAAKGGDANAIYPWKGNNLIFTDKGKYKGMDRSNYKREGALALTIDKSTGNIDITAPVYSFLPNKYGIYNMSGNVAEMISEEGFTKGGGWATGADKLKIGSRDEYDNKPNPNTGFRPVMVPL